MIDAIESPTLTVWWGDVFYIAKQDVKSSLIALDLAQQLIENSPELWANKLMPSAIFLVFWQSLEILFVS